MIRVALGGHAQVERPVVLASEPRPATPAVAAEAPALLAREASAAERVRALVEAHFDSVWRVVRALGVPAADADDAAQEVFLVASRKLDAIAPGRERAFLFGTARGVAANQRRSAGRREALAADELPDVLDDAPRADELVDAARARVVLERALAALAPEHREPFVLFELEELSTAEIAEALTLPVGTVASRLRRARELFRAEVARLEARARFEGRRP